MCKRKETAMRVLLTGGTGFLGQALVHVLLDMDIQVVVFSRNAEKQEAMRESYGKNASLEFVVGHVTDCVALKHAMERDVQVVVHAAALVRGCDDNVNLATHTNVTGTQKIVAEAMNKADKVLIVSTSAAVCPTNVYGATKLLAERVALRANNPATDTVYSCVRFGNLIGSGVIAQFRRSVSLRITDPRMTRFWLTAEQAAQHILRCLGHMKGGEIFVPRQPAASIIAIAAAVAPGCETRIVGMRPGEQLHATLITSEEARRTHMECDWYEEDDLFIIRKTANPSLEFLASVMMPDGYRSDLATWQLTTEEIQRKVFGDGHS